MARVHEHQELQKEFKEECKQEEEDEEEDDDECVEEEEEDEYESDVEIDCETKDSGEVDEQEEEAEQAPVEEGRKSAKVEQAAQPPDGACATPAAREQQPTVEVLRRQAELEKENIELRRQLADLLLKQQTKASDASAPDAQNLPAEVAPAAESDSDEADPEVQWDVIVKRTFICAVPRRPALAHTASAPGRLIASAHAAERGRSSGRRRSQRQRRNSRRQGDGRRARSRQGNPQAAEMHTIHRRNSVADVG